MKRWNALIARSQKIKDVIVHVTKETPIKPSKTRWWSSFEQVVQITGWSEQLTAVEEILRRAMTLELCKETANKMLKLLQDPL